MTFVGKVLVVVQVVLSLCFMAFAGAVYTVQQDWKEAYEKKVTDLQQRDTELQEKNEQIAFLNKDLAAAQAIEDNIQTYLDGIDQFLAGQTEDDRIKTQLRMLATRAQQAEQRVAKLENDVAQNEQLLMVAKENYEKLESENKKVVDEAKERGQEADLFKKINRDLNNQVAVYQDENFNLKNQLFNLDTEAKSAAEKQKSLLVQVAHLRDVIRRENIDEKQALAKDEPPPVVYGKVINTKAADRSGPEYVEINIGADDGLSVGNKLYVFSTNGDGKYMGEIRLVHVVNDRAVGEVVLKSKNGVIQREDNVTTKL